MTVRVPGTATAMFDGYRDGDPQSESVTAPPRDDDPPRRTRAPLIVWTVALLAVFGLAAALIWAAVDAA